MDPEALAAEVAMLQQPSSPSLPFELPPSPPIDAMEWARASDESCTDDQPMLSVKHSSLDALLDACQPFDPSPFDPSPLSKPRSTGNLTSLVPTEPQTSGTVYGSISSSENDADAAPSPSAPQSSSVIFVLVISLCWTVLGLHQGFPLLGFEYWEKLVLKLNPAGAAMINAIMLLPWFALPLVLPRTVNCAVYSGCSDPALSAYCSAATLYCNLHSHPLHLADTRCSLRCFTLLLHSAATLCSLSTLLSSSAASLNLCVVAGGLEVSRVVCLTTRRASGPAVGNRTWVGCRPLRSAHFVRRSSGPSHSAQLEQQYVTAASGATAPSTHAAHTENHSREYLQLTPDNN